MRCLVDWDDYRAPPMG